MYKQAGALCIVGSSDFTATPPLKHFYHHISPSFITSVFFHHCIIIIHHHMHHRMHHHFFHQEIPSKEIHFCTIKFSIKKIHQRKSIFALSSFPSKKSIKGNPFLHHHFFHQEIPSKEIHHLHYQIFHHNIIILFHQFFSSLLRAYLMGGKSELPTMHKAAHRI